MFYFLHNLNKLKKELVQDIACLERGLMKVLKISKSVILIMLMFLAATLIRDANTNSSDQIHTYKYTPIPNDLTVEIKNPLEAYPNQTINVNITIKALVNLTLNQVAIKLYTFNDSKFDDVIYVEKENPVSISSSQLLNKTSNVTIHEQASNIVYGKLTLEWTKKGSEGWETIGKEPTFIMAFLKNLELERLRSKVPELEKENAELKGNVTDLNNTLTDLLNNLTDIENRYAGELGGTRSAVAILAITTIFFVATTAYLFLRKPKQYW